MGFSAEQVSAFVAMIGILSMIAQVSCTRHILFVNTVCLCAFM